MKTFTDAVGSNECKASVSVLEAESTRKLLPEQSSVAVSQPPAATHTQDGPLQLGDYFKCEGDPRAVLVAMKKTLRDNAGTLLTRVNRLMRQFGENRRVVRGFAPTVECNEPFRQFNEPFLPSRHQTAEAVDVADPEGDLDQWLLDNQRLLESCGLWIEHPATTRGHCHLQSVPPKGGSRRRVFYP